MLERAANVKILAVSFWKKFSQIILPGRLRHNKWSTSHENIKVSDVVHVSSSRMMESRYRMAIVVEAKPGANSLVRTVTIRTPTQHIKEVSILCLKLVVSDK